MSQQPEPGLPLTVLVVDDEPASADTLAATLNAFGFLARAAHGGEEARRLAIAEPPDVILLDLLMPKLGGLELARILRDRPWPKRPLLVAVTGLGGDNDRRESEAAGIDLHLTKPIDADALLAMLERFRRILVGPNENGP